MTTGGERVNVTSLIRNLPDKMKYGKNEHSSCAVHLQLVSSVTGYSPDILCMLLSIWAFRLGPPWDFFPFWTFVLHELHEV